MRPNLAFVALAILLLSGVARGQADHPTNERMFDYCKLHQAIRGDASKFNDSNAIQATTCVSWAIGAFQMYNMRESSCDLQRRSVNTFIDDYVAMVRKTGTLEHNATLSASIMMDVCYCGKDKWLAPGMCKQ